MTFGPSTTQGPFLPINQTFSKDQDVFLLQITKLYADIARYLNIREIAIFDLTEVPTGEQWFNSANTQIKRDGFRQVYSIGAINAGATSITAHNISGFSTLTFTHIYGTAVTAADQRPIPYASVTAVNQQIEIKADSTNITIINGAGAPNIISCVIILEYLKN